MTVIDQLLRLCDAVFVALMVAEVKKHNAASKPGLHASVSVLPGMKRLLVGMHRTVIHSGRPVEVAAVQTGLLAKQSLQQPRQLCHCSRQAPVSATVQPNPAGVRPRGLIVAAAGLPFALSRPQKVLKFKWGRKYSGYDISDLQVEVDALSEGQPAGLTAAEVEQLLEQLQQDAEQAVPLALQAKQQVQPGYRLPAIANLSLVLCDDAHVQQLNKEYRGKDAPTDVLSFEIPDEAPSLQLPVKLLGDLVISLDTAQQQADERG